jgi:hypothetical protein
VSDFKLTEPAMPDRNANEKIDAPTSRAVAHGIGEKLRQSLGAESHFPDRLQRLLNALRDREAHDDTSDKGG